MTDVKKLYRNPDGKMFCGVCAGIADYFKLDVNIVRVALIIATFCGGVGAVAYIAAALLIPEKPANVQ